MRVCLQVGFTHISIVAFLNLASVLSVGAFGGIVLAWLVLPTEEYLIRDGSNVVSYGLET